MVIDGIEEAREYCKLWAADRKAVFEDHGTVGFFRPCVGIISGTQYIAYDYEDKGQLPYLYVSADDWHVAAYLAPDAYHKGEYLCVLAGWGPDGDDPPQSNYDAATLQLAAWLKKLEPYTIETVPRRPDNMFDAALHGFSYGRLARK